MSVRENIELYGLPSEEQYVEILIREFGAAKHPNQADGCILESRPFCAPRLADDHISILSFNNIPLPDSMVEALIDHPELFPNDIRSDARATARASGKAVDRSRGVTGARDCSGLVLHDGRGQIRYTGISLGR